MSDSNSASVSVVAGRFNDKVALLTGAASGIGQATALRIGREGGTVFAVDVQEQMLQETSALLEKEGIKHATHICDVSDKAAVNATVASCVKEFGKLDVLGNIAGLLRFDNFVDLEPEDWHKLFSVNVDGVIFMCQAAIPHLLESGGNIVNAGSTAGIAGLPWGTAYSASKGAVIALTRSIAIEYAKRGIRVNSVSPGSISTNMTSKPKFPDGVDWDLINRSAAINGPMGPEVIASTIAMLGSDDGAHMNGVNVRVDGGCLS